MTSGSSAMRRALTALASVAIAVAIAGCGSSAATSPSPIAAASQAAPASAPAASAPPAESASAPPASAPASSPASSPGPDPAAGLKIDAPYTLTALPPALQQTIETQMAAGLGASGGMVQMGFRQIGGGSAAGSMLMVIAFPSGSLSASAYQAALSGVGASMGATFETSTVDGVDVANGKAATGGLAVFQIGDHMLMVISPAAAESLPIATALIKANQ